MSTYSWSYKTAVHHQVSAKRAKTDQEDADKNAVSQMENDSVISQISNNDAASTVIPKRLNWRAKIYVGNLNKKTNEASLAYYFSVFGDIEDIKLIRDHDTKESRGFAFITFEKIEAAEKAKKWCSFNYPTLDDNSITVASAERKTHKMKMSKNEQKAKRDPSQTLFWEFRWTNAENAQVYGPYETSLMQAWKNQGYFDRGCWVRQVLHRHVSRAGEKHEGKNLEVTVAEEDAQNSSTNAPQENTADESCEAGPCKKPKLVIQYSDSEDDGDDDGDDGDDDGDGDDGDDGDDEGGDGDLRLGENAKQDSEKERLQVDENNQDKVVEVKQGESSNENEQLKQRENGKLEDSSLNKEHLQTGESNPKMEVKQDESSCDDEQLRPRENEKQMNENKLDSAMKEMTNSQQHRDENKKQNDSSLSKEPLQCNENYESTLCVEQSNEENLTVLQMYEQGMSSVLSEHQDGEHQRNEDDTRESDDSSSEEEDIESDDISTEFVAISEIDFNLYP